MCDLRNNQLETFNEIPQICTHVIWKRDEKKTKFLKNITQNRRK